MNAATAARARKRVMLILSRLPESAIVGYDGHCSLEVRKKRFAWLLEDHNGDGRVAINCKSTPDTRLRLSIEAPDHYHEPKYLARHGWAGLWLDVPKVNWSLVEMALRQAWRGAAPKALVAQSEK